MDDNVCIYRKKLQYTKPNAGIIRAKLKNGKITSEVLAAENSYPLTCITCFMWQTIGNTVMCQTTADTASLSTLFLNSHFQPLIQYELY